jgi:hypothetical protein
MLYYIHHPAGNVVIRTTNPYIVLQYQPKGWLTTTSFEQVLHDHAEWRTDVQNTAAPHESERHSGPGIVSRFRSALCRFLPTYTSAQTTPLLSTSTTTHAAKVTTGREGGDNTGPIHWMTAVEREWYRERGYKTSATVWIVCEKDERMFDYRLESGVWDLDALPSYDTSAGQDD